MGETVPGETMQTLPKASAGRVSMLLLAPSRGASFHPLEEKLGQVLPQGAALEPWPRDFAGVQQIL